MNAGVVSDFALLERTRLSFIVDHPVVAQQWSQTMTRAGRSMVSGTAVPEATSNSVAEPGVEYYITARDAAGNSATLPATAKVGPEEAARLGKDLTPIGAEKAGNKDGTIPAWEGGITRAPSGYRAGQFHPNPFADDPIRRYAWAWSQLADRTGRHLDVDVDRTPRVAEPAERTTCLDAGLVHGHPFPLSALDERASPAATRCLARKCAARAK